MQVKMREFIRIDEERKIEVLRVFSGSYEKSLLAYGLIIVVEVSCNWRTVYYWRCRVSL